MPNVLTFDGQKIYSTDGSVSGVRVIETRWIKRSEVVLDRIGSYDAQGVIRSVVPVDGIFQMDVLLGEHTYNDSGDWMRTWRSWHSADIGRALLKVSRDDGVQMQMYCAARTPQEKGRTGYRRTILQEYEAETPWFQAITPTTVSTNFNGATPVNLSVPVGGDLAVRPVYTITGPVENGKIVLDGDTLVELTLNVLSGQTLVIDCTRMIDMTWTGSGVTDENALGYFASASLFSPLPVGTNTLVLTAEAGSTGGLSVETTYLYEDIGV